MILSVVLVVGGIALGLMTRSSAPERPYYGPVDAVFYLATVLTFSVVGAIIASRQPRNAIGWIFCGVGVVRFVVVDHPGIPPHELPVAVVPRRQATLATLAPRGLMRCVRSHRLPRGLHAGAGTARRLPTDREPLRRRQPHSGCGCGHRCHPGFG